MEPTGKPQIRSVSRASHQSRVHLWAPRHRRSRWEHSCSIAVSEDQQGCWWGCCCLLAPTRTEPGTQHYPWYTDGDRICWHGEGAALGDLGAGIEALPRVILACHHVVCFPGELAITNDNIIRAFLYRATVEATTANPYGHFYLELCAWCSAETTVRAGEKSNVFQGLT